MIKETVSEHRFTDVLMADEYAAWSYGATKALYDYYEQLSEDMGKDIELDPVAIRCEWTEYNSALECYKDYNTGTLDLAMTDYDTEDVLEENARIWLKERTTVLNVENVDTTANEYRTIKSILVAEF